MAEEINHPPHYGGEGDPFETINVIEAWNLNFNLGNCVKYISRAGRKMGESHVTALKKAKFYLEREIANRMKQESKIIHPVTTVEVMKKEK